MKIWVYLNGLQQGPYSPEQLSQLPIDRSTPVWYEGLPQWMPAGEAPETARLFGDDAPSADTSPVASMASADTVATPTDHTAAARTDLPAPPPTFIGWSVFCLICCFPIGGLLGIVFSVMSGNAYNRGDYPRAARLSEWSEWCVILSIVMGLMFTPLALIFL